MFLKIYVPSKPTPRYIFLPVAWFLRLMVEPISGSPFFLSVTVPFIISCAYVKLKAEQKKRVKSRGKRFFMWAGLKFGTKKRLPCNQNITGMLRNYKYKTI